MRKRTKGEEERGGRKRERRKMGGRKNK